MGTFGAILNLTEIAQKGAVLHRTWLDADITITEVEQNSKEEWTFRTLVERCPIAQMENPPLVIVMHACSKINGCRSKHV